jgi:lysophospholipase L1-like esterase
MRDDDGSITAVRPTPVYVQFHNGLVDSTSKILFTHRLFSKLYFTSIEYPRLLARYNERRPNDNLFLAKLPAAEARQIHASEIEHFKSTLDDLTRTVVARVGSPQRLIYIHHPHLGHLSTTGIKFNNVVSEVLRDVASRNNVRYYDATEELKVEFGGSPETYYIPDDVHFNAAGTRAYGIAVGKYLAHALGDN